MANTITGRMSYEPIRRPIGMAKELGMGYSASLKMPEEAKDAFRKIAKELRDKPREYRKLRAGKGWWNWYHNRGRLSLTVPQKIQGRELRMISHRRCL